MRTTALRLGTIAVAASCLVLAIGCASGNATTGTNGAAPTARGGGPRSHATNPLPYVRAVDAVAKESCAHEQRCDRVGPGRRFAAPAGCMEAMEKTSRKNLAVCDTGFVEADALADCVAAIRAGSCGEALDNACRFDQLCSP